MTSQATVPDTARVAGEVVLPTLAGGVIKRRPRVLALADALQVDRPAVRVLRRLRARYGKGPVLLRVPGRSIALVLDPDDVGRVLGETPSPFSPASFEKRAALNHFQPHAVLVSQGSDRERRREFNEDVLETGHAAHSLAGPARAVVLEEAGHLLSATGGNLDWDSFAAAWWRIVRRIVLGDSARDDTEVTGLLASLRLRANWAYLAPKARDRRAEFRRRLDERIDRAEPGSLAQRITEHPAGEGLDPHGQVPHWLFAFDAAGMATLRALAVLATHPLQAERAREDLGKDTGGAGEILPYLRACVLDTVRLWPTTPVLLRESTTATSWRGTVLPPGTTFFVFTPYFHRDRETVPFADVFEPDVWLDGRAQRYPALVPFSDGPGRCPGEDLVLFVTSALLADLLRDREWWLREPRTLGPDRRLPATLDNFRIKLMTRPA